MKLVELISALQTTPETLDRARSFATACGKGSLAEDNTSRGY
jgi:3-hydroxybutyryl-CoA dehydrogenase